MNANPKVPPNLYTTQKWFASIITSPIDCDSQINPISPSGRPIVEEAKDFISPNPKLTSDERIQIYNQQYWWRLLSTLHQNFPALTRLFGYTDFNLSIGMPFLTKYPSRHWSLSQLGDQLSSWISKYYTAEDKELIFSVAEVDWAYHSLFYAPPPIDIHSTPDLLSKKLDLQSNIKIFNFPFDIFALRTDLLKQEVVFWMESDFPILAKEKNYFFILYTFNNLISYKEIEEGQWIILKLISEGFTIEQACDVLEKRGGRPCLEAEASLGLWIQEWMNRNWLMLRE